MKQKKGNFTKLFAALLTASVLLTGMPVSAANFGNTVQSVDEETKKETETEKETEKETETEITVDVEIIMPAEASGNEQEDDPSADDTAPAPGEETPQDADDTPSDNDDSNLGMQSPGIIQNGVLTKIDGEIDADGRQKYATEIPGIYVYIDTDFTDIDETHLSNNSYDLDISYYPYIKKVTMRFEVDETVAGETKLPISDAVIAAMNIFARDIYGVNSRPDASYSSEPGDLVLFDFIVTTAEGQKHTFQYRDGSFKITTPSHDDKELSPFTGADNQEIPWDRIGSLAKSKPIQDLFGRRTASDIKNDRDRSENVTLTDIITIYDKLAACTKYGKDGYSTISDYMLDYYNDKDGTSYESLEDLIAENPDKMIEINGGYQQAQFSRLSASDIAMLLATYPEQLEQHQVSAVKDRYGTYTLYFKWNDPVLGPANYNLFYNDLLKIVYGEDLNFEDEDAYNTFRRSLLGPDNTATNYGILDYMYNNEDAWTKVNDYFNQLDKLGFSPEAATSISFQMAMGLDGPGMNNSYQNYNFSYGNEIILEQVDGGINVLKTDAEGTAITTDTAEFNLYYIALNDDGSETTLYYAIDEDGNGFFTEDVSKAAVLVTDETGKIQKQYLMPRDYYLKEIKAPNGFKLNTEALKIAVEKGKITEVSFTNIPEDPEPEDPEPETKETETKETETKETETKETETKETETKETETKETETKESESKPKTPDHPETKSPTSQPAMGDTFNITFPAVSAVISLIVMLCTFVFVKRRRED